MDGVPHRHRPRRSPALTLLVVASLGLAACAATTPTSTPAPWTSTTVSATPSAASTAVALSASHPCVGAAVPARWQHVVWIVMENKAAGDVLEAPSAPGETALAHACASASDYRAHTHPSLPNYLAFWSGSTNGVTDDAIHDLAGPSLSSQLAAAGRSWRIYAQDYPAGGCNTAGAYTGGVDGPGVAGTYARKHNPWVNFTDLPSSVNQTMAAFPTSFASLPTVSVVVPNQLNDMHSGTIAQGDAWLKAHLSGYVTWAKAHNSILVVTWDSDDHTAHNKIATVIVGAHVRVGAYGEALNHYRLLRTIQSMYGLAALGASANYAPVTDTWN